MERDIDKIISLKVSTAERTPAYWQKDQVWQRIQSASNRRPLWKLRYAAAFILMSCCLSIYFYYRYEQKGFRTELTPLREASHQPVKQRVPVNQVEQRNESVLTKSAGVATFTDKESLEGEFVVVADTPVVSALPQESITVVPFTDITQATVQSDTLAEPVIDAIIGVIPAVHSGLRTAKAKKVRFKLQRVNEFPDLDRDTESPHVITARIN